MKNVLLTLLLICLAIFSLGFGDAPLSTADIITSLTTSEQTTAQLIIFELRIPRIILAVVIGFSLGLAGAVMQGWLRNPLAEPGLLGVSGGASLGAVLSIYFGTASVNLLILPLAGLAGALVSGLLLLLFAARHASSLSLILAGLALQSLMSALAALALNLAPNPHAALDIAYWMMGSLSDRSLQHIILALPFMVCGAAVLFSTGYALRCLSLGEATALTMGVNLGRLKIIVTLGIALCVGSSVAVAGSIPFVGLVAPHIARTFIHVDPQKLLLPSALIGAILLLLADSAIRALPLGYDLKLGVLISLIGVPFMLIILYNHHKQGYL
jgi:iron complex transport system permease protein